MISLGYDILHNALIATGLRSGDTVMIQSSLLHIGPVEGVATRSGLAEFYYRVFRDVIGPEGTVLVHTPFEAYGRRNEPFDTKSSPSTAGLLSEYVLALPGAVRSLHPIVSVAGVGPAADKICGGNHCSGFGWDSPWGRMHRRYPLRVPLARDWQRVCHFCTTSRRCMACPTSTRNCTERRSIAMASKCPGHSHCRSGILILEFNTTTPNSNGGCWTPVRHMRRVSSEGCCFSRRRPRKPLPAGSIASARTGSVSCKPLRHFRPGEIPVDGATGEMKPVYHEPRRSRETTEQ